MWSLYTEIKKFLLYLVHHKGCVCHGRRQSIDMLDFKTRNEKCVRYQSNNPDMSRLAVPWSYTGVDETP